MKKIINENFRVVIEPQIGWTSNEEQEEKELRTTCKWIMDGVRRHIDDVACTYMEYDTREVCSHCGYDWEENENPNDPDWLIGEPVCCSEASEEYRDNLKGE